MTQQVLITGGAGFIGSHLADELLACGYRVRALDNLAQQVHGDARKRPGYLAAEVELIAGDIRNEFDVRRALRGVDAVYHFAAVVGVGQSMYEVVHYTSVNNLGTAVLLEALMKQPVQNTPDDLLALLGILHLLPQGPAHDRKLLEVKLNGLLLQGDQFLLG